MRAFCYKRYGGVSVLQCAEFPEPVIQDSHEVIVRVKAAGLNPLDYKRRGGATKTVIPDKWPQRIGYDVCGVVTSCGANASKFHTGDEVFGMLPHNGVGSLGEQIAVHESYLAKKPSNMTFVEAASIPLVGTATLQAFRKAGLAEGKKVLVTGGAGGVGTAAIQIAKNVFKASTVVTTGSESKIEMLKDLGADEIIDYHAEAFEKKVSGIDVALDCTKEAQKCIKCVAPQGAVVSLAEIPTSEEMYRYENMQGVHTSWITGCFLNLLTWSTRSSAGGAGVRYEYLFSAGDEHTIENVREICEEGKLHAVVDRAFPFDQTLTAFEYLETGHATGKVVVEMP